MNQRVLLTVLGLGALILGVLALATAGRVALAQGDSPPDGDVGISGAPISSAHFALNWNVSAPGGSSMTSTHFRLSSTAGQSVVGRSTSTHFGHRAGFWQEFIYRIWLPLILKNT
jgi:hypothetical protein